MNRTPFEKAGDFLLGRGFYIVLFLCVATIGLSGYYLIQTMTPDSPSTTISPTGAAPEIVIPDPVPVEPVLPAPNPIKPTTVVKEPEPAAVVKPDTIVIPTKPSTSTSPAVFTWPVKGGIMRDFSVDTLMPDATMGDWRTHCGIDIAANLGTSVLAPSDGTVLSVLEDDLMGTTVVIEHENGVQSVLANLSPVAVVKAGDTVTTGTVIGAVGETALSESAMEPHLHFEMSKDGDVVNPLDYLPK